MDLKNLIPICNADEKPQPQPEPEFETVEFELRYFIPGFDDICDAFEEFTDPFV